VATKKEKNPNHNKQAPRAEENNEEFKGVAMWSKLIRRMTDEVVYLKKCCANVLQTSIKAKSQLLIYK